MYGTVLGSDSRGARNEALRELLAYGLDQYRRVQVIDHGRVYAEATTGYGQPDVQLVAPRTIVGALRNGKPLVERVVAPTTLALPVAKGERLGRVEVYDGNTLVASSNLVAAESVAEAGFFAKATWYATQTACEPLGDDHVIVTVTTNAALDRTLTVPVFQIGFRHRSSEVLTLAGGKGINVARALKILDVPVVATGLAGGRTGTRIIEELTSEAILNDFVRIAAESRTSTAVVDPTAGTHTEINEWGPEVGAVELETLVEKLHYLSRGADFVVLSGSLPRKVATTFYADAVRDLSRRDVRVVLDSEGEPLRLAVEAGPFLVSPNQREAEQLVGPGARGRRRLPHGARRDRRDGSAQRPHHARERVLRASCASAGRRGGFARSHRMWSRCPASARATSCSRSSSPRSATSVRRTTRSALAVAAGAASVREVGAGRFDPAYAATLAADIELAELHPVRS